MAELQSGAVYKLINAKAGNCLDLSGQDNTTVIGYGYHGGDNQKVRTQGYAHKNVAVAKRLGSSSGYSDKPLAVGRFATSPMANS